MPHDWTTNFMLCQYANYQCVYDCVFPKGDEIIRKCRRDGAFIGVKLLSIGIVWKYIVEGTIQFHMVDGVCNSHGRSCSFDHCYNEY